ncbi:MAG: CocE/NonD family hydrolase [Cyanobacteria bacterium J06632_22]
MPSPLLSVRPCQTRSMRTRDGVRLDADVYVPDGPGPFPVLLMRQPYGREIASTVVYAHPTWYATHGYMVVIQDVRGRGTSEGDFRLFTHEVEDGYDTVEWAANLPESNGRVGMYGFSYQGMTQLYAAQSQPSALKALAPAMAGTDLYQDWAYENGALRLQAGLGWALQLAAETARLKGETAAFTALRAASRNLPLHGPVTAYPELMQQYAPDSYWHDWIAHPQDDAYWQALTPDLSQVDLPMLHIGGWFDPYLTGDLRRYKTMTGPKSSPQQLWVGPWGHIPWHRKVGAVDFGPEAMNPIDTLQIRWFDQFLKGQDTGILTGPTVHLFEMGSNRWQHVGRWPPTDTSAYALRSSGLAGVREDDGVLIAPTATLTPPHVDTLVHDPWRPVPSLGGHTGMPSGPFERTHIDGRSDVLTYTLGPIGEPMSIAGVATVSLVITTDVPSFDISAVLSVVYPDQTVVNMTQGYGRFTAESDSAADSPIHLRLQPTCCQIGPGQSLRLSLSAASFPAYTVNPGTGAPLPDQVPVIDQRLITLTIHQGQDTVLRLPIPPLRTEVARIAITQNQGKG